MARKKLPVPEDDHDHAVSRDIRRVGWSVTQIVPDDENDTGPVYSFSVGLVHTHGHPEVILLGLSHEVARQIINDVGAAVAGGLRVEPGRTYDDFAGVPLAFVGAAPTHCREYVGYALWLYHGPGFPMLQLVWPLKSGHFPWDQGDDHGGAAVQPLLSRAGPDATPGRDAARGG